MNDKFTNNTNDDENIARKLDQVADQTQINAQFSAELEERLRIAHQPKVSWFASSFKQVSPTLRWVALVILLVLVLNWSIKSLIPAPQPGIDGTPAMPDTATPSPEIAINETATPAADDAGYDWRGSKLYLDAPLPTSPAEASVYLLKPDQPAALEEARTLAQRFGLDGEVYQAPGQVPNTADYFFTDGKQSLSVNSDLFFAYTADMAKTYNNFEDPDIPNADEIIENFLAAHGFDFPHKIKRAELYAGYVVEPLSPDGFPMRYEYFSSRPLLVTLGEDGQVLRFEANLMDYESTGPQKYGILTAEEAFQKILDQNVVTGIMEGMIGGGHSASGPVQEWKRIYPTAQMITIHGYASSIQAFDPTEPPFVQIGGYTATGNITEIDKLERNTYIEATGQFITENEIEKFKIESWKVPEALEDGLVGTIQRDGQNVILATEDGQYTLPDVPNDIPMPFESAFVVGVKIGDTFDWTLIDNRMVNGGGGGGGGGGGLGFYKLNLSGTPVPLPSPTVQPEIPQGNGDYIVQENDTLSFIALNFGITVDELMQANGLNENAIFVGQKLIIPNPNSNPDQPSVGQQYEGHRGILTVRFIKEPGGTQRIEYYLAINNHDGLYPYVMLEGDGLEELQAAHNRPVDIWGKVVRYEQQYQVPVVAVEKFSIPFPDLQFQILKGQVHQAEIEGQTVNLFTAENGTTYVQLVNTGDLDTNALGDSDNQAAILEALIIPGETYGDYPTLRVYSSALAISPKNGQPIDLTVTADQPYVMDEQALPEPYTPPTATIENVELTYYVTNQHWQVEHLVGGPQYIQPAWRFSGHYSNGDEFEILVQALKQEYLLPELAPYIQGG